MSFTIKFITLIMTLSLLSTHQAAAITLGQVATTAKTASVAAFNSVEMVAYQANDRVPQWNRVKVTLKNDDILLQACLDNSAKCTGVAMNSWRDMVIGLKGQDDTAKLSMVNAFFNHWQYRSDADAYGQSEYWASPLEFMKNSGDCEDYAIAKYATLAFLGFTDSQMRIVAVLDNNRGGQGHSVLSVSTNGQKMILDNQSSEVYADNQQNGYAPRFAVNQTNVYTYASQPQLVYASYVK